VLQIVCTYALSLLESVIATGFPATDAYSSLYLATVDWMRWKKENIVVRFSRRNFGTHEKNRHDAEKMKFAVNMNTVACRAVTMQRPLDRYTRAACKQRFGKHVAESTNRRVSIVVLLDTMCILVGPFRGFIRKTVGATKSALYGI
jgi:hypothetical protein